jgi:cyclopropane-fatty-acyl-phospholipid synthase
MHDTQTSGASAEAIRHHYDVGNDFYRLWLDPTLTYSCALWESESETLEKAQVHKLDYLATQAHVHGAQRVLDVGCGWGSLLKRLVEHHDVREVVGLTLSDAQQAHIASWRDPRCKALCESWADHQPDEPYDAIISIGAMEHFVTLGVPRADRVEIYRRFLTQCHRMLRPGGWMALQTIGKGNTPVDDVTAADLAFLLQTIFPETDVPRLAEIAHAAEKRFEVVALRNDRMQYARTCAAWLAQLTHNRARAVEVTGEATVSIYERYLRASIRQFERDQAVLYRITLRRV